MLRDPREPRGRRIHDEAVLYIERALSYRLFGDVFDDDELRMDVIDGAKLTVFPAVDRAFSKKVSSDAWLLWTDGAWLLWTDGAWLLWTDGAWLLWTDGAWLLWTDGAWLLWTDGAWLLWTDGAWLLWTDGAWLLWTDGA
jgi:hypothetical protein